MRPGARYLLDLRRLQPYAMREREALIQQPDASQMADERAAVGAIVIARDRRVSFRLVDMAEHPQIGALRQPRQQVEIFLGADFRRRRPERPGQARMASGMTLALALDPVDQLARAAAALHRHRGAAAQLRRDQLVPERPKPAARHVP